MAQSMTARPRGRFADRVACLLVLVGCAAHAQSQGWPDFLDAADARGGGENDAALIVGIENYVNLPSVPGALDNARAWYSFLTRTLQVPPASVRLLQDRDAAVEAIRKEAAATAGRVKAGGRLWVVFIGHGATAEDGSDGILIGADALQSPESLYARSIRQGELLKLLSTGKQELAIVFLDACFSGRTGSGAPVVEGLQPVVLLKSEAERVGRTLVLSAGTSKQFAGPLPGERRPAFSYLALGGLRGWADADENGLVTAEELIGYGQQALGALLSGREQTPQLSPSELDTTVLVRKGSGSMEKGPNLSAVQVWIAQGGSGTRVRSPLSRWWWAPAAGGALVGGVGVLFLVQSKAELARLKTATPENPLSSTEATSIRTRGPALQAGGIGLIGLGAVSILSGVAMAYFGARQDAALSFALVPGPTPAFVIGGTLP